MGDSDVGSVYEKLQNKYIIIENEAYSVYKNFLDQGYYFRTCNKFYYRVVDSKIYTLEELREKYPEVLV